MHSPRIYLDHAATSPPRPEVRRILREAAEEPSGNPSSTHAEGQAARARIEEARGAAAAAFGVVPAEVVFVSSGAEASSTAVLGAAAARAGGGAVVTLEGEAAHVADPVDELEDRGIPVVRLPRGGDGGPEPEALRAALRDARLVTLSYADPETGLLAPGNVFAEARAAGVPLHVEGSAAFGAVPTAALGLAATGADFVSVSTHRAGGPAGAGVLLVRRGTRLRPLVLGGRQESGRRAGMENTAAIRALAEVLAVDFEAEATRLAGLRDRLEESLLRRIPDAKIVAGGRARLPRTTCAVFSGLEAEALAIRLDLSGVAASAGAACTSGTTEPAPVLLALGLTRTDAAAALRLSVGWTTTEEEVDRAVEILAEAVSSVRALHPAARLP